MTATPGGPHGSTNPFILKRPWDQCTGTNGNLGGGGCVPSDGRTSTLGDLCFKCHDYATYAGNGGARTGFYDNSSGKADWHSYHVNRIGRIRCSWCHAAVPHGWKNKSMLVSLNDVGPEVGQAKGTEIAQASLPYTNGPYYMNSYLKVRNFRCGGWADTDCGSAGGGGGTGKTWMGNTCQNGR